MSGPSSSDGWGTGVLSAERTTEPVIKVPGLKSTTKDRATFTIMNGISAGQVLALDGAEHVIGRGTEADVWVDDGGVSRRHARVSLGPDGRHYIEDLGSTNGTFVGAARVNKSEIKSGDRIQLGGTVLRFAIIDDVEEELQRRLFESSTRDALTRVYNRKHFNERLNAEVAYSRRHRVNLAVLVIDLDDFKAVNDTFGHLAGDMVLRLVSAQMQRLIRLEDLLARYGGEEFVILARSTGKKEAMQLAERVRQAIADLPIMLGDKTLRVTTSIGVAALPDVGNHDGPSELLALADARHYAAKAAGKNRVCADT
jgi:diguanylate cyclase (GGDEF)-like protein